MQKKGYHIDPPPKESGTEPLFRVVYVIDVNASSALRAAKLTHQIMADPDSLAPVLEVIDQGGKVIKIDLSRNR